MSGQWRTIIGRIVAVGSFIGWFVSMLIFFGVDAKAIGKAWQSMSAHYVFAILAASFFLIFVMALYYLWQNSRITPENIEPRITEWLDAFGLTRQKLSEPSCYFAYKVVVQTNVPLVVLRAKNHDRYLTFVSNVGFADEEKTLFNNLSEPKKEEFIRGMRLEAAKAEIGTSLDRSSYIWTIERRMPITANLTEADFIQNIDAVNYSVLIIIDTIGTLLRANTRS
jgi:hypothetical protein